MPVVKDIKVLDFDGTMHNEWLTVAQSSASATFFHTPYWASLWCNQHGDTVPICYNVTFDDGVSLYLPAIQEKKLGGIIVRKQSMPGGTYGGFIYDRNVAVRAQHIQEGGKSLLRKGNWVIRENPFDTNRLNMVSSLDFEDDFTQCIDIHNGYSAFLSGTDYAHRKNVKKASQAGLLPGSSEEWDHWVQYYSVYEKSINRWEKKRLRRRSFYSLAFFRELFNLDKKFRKLWTVTINGRIASGIICFYWNKHVAAWHGAGDEEFFAIRPNNLLYNAAVEHACVNNYYWFDCNPSGGFEGVIRFKKFLGTEMMPSGVLNKKSGLLSFCQMLKNCSYRISL